MSWNNFRCNDHGMEPLVFWGNMKRISAYNCALRVWVERCETYYFKNQYPASEKA